LTARKMSKKTMKTKLDALCRVLVMERDGHKCRKCGVPDKGGRQGLQWAHIYSRRYLTIRWNPLNSMALCPSCHFFIHQNPLEGAEWVASWMPASDREVLREKLKKPGRFDFEAELARLREATGS